MDQPTLHPVSPLTIGRFEVIGRLGQGAQSVVYLAHDPRLHREVALKVVHLADDDAQRAALLHEARAVSRLMHPGIVPVFEAQETGDGFCLAFEYVAGRSLADRIAEEGAMGPAAAVGLLLPVLDAVDYAHSHRIVHRDLKPSNILLDDELRPRVMDFGIAIRHVPDAEDDDRSTAMLGTPAYMAPEYSRGGLVSPAMDVFAAGLILYELLCGQRAVGTQDGVRAIRFLLNHDVVLPEATATSCGEALSAIVHRALARDPALRYSSMNELAHALREWLDPVQRPPSAQDEMAQASLLDTLLARVPSDLRFPSSTAVLDALRRVESTGEVQHAALVNLAIGDVPLMLELLRRANSSQARGMGAIPVSNLSAAVLAVLSLGGGEILRDGHERRGVEAHAEPAASLARLHAQSLFCGMLSRELSGLLDQDGEEALLAGVLHQLGRLLLVHCFPEEAANVLAAGSRSQQEARARRRFGLGLEELALAVARQWGLPEVLQRCVRVSRADELLNMPSTRAELLHMSASAAGELTDLQFAPEGAAAQGAMEDTLRRYRDCLCLSRHEVNCAIREVLRKMPG